MFQKGRSIAVYNFETVVKRSGTITNLYEHFTVGKVYAVHDPKRLSNHGHGTFTIMFQN
jgi:hypothetical protein